MNRMQQVSHQILGLLNHEFFPATRRYFKWIREPVAWFLFAAISSLLAGILVSTQAYVLMAGILGLLFLGIVWPWLSVRFLAGEINFGQSRCHSGESIWVTIEIKNRSPLPAFGIVVPDFENSTDDAHAAQESGILLGRIPGWSTSRYQWQINPTRRGALPIAIPRISCGFPFGLISKSRTVSSGNNLLVWPRLLNTEAPSLSGGVKFSTDEANSFHAGDQGDTIGVREYRHGDSTRNIHWAHSSRLNKLYVKERQSWSRDAVIVVVDARSAIRHSTKGYERLIETAASLCWQYDRIGARVELHCMGIDGAPKEGVSNQNGIRQILDFTSRLPVFSQLTFIDAHRTPIRHFGKSLILVTHSTAPAPINLHRNAHRIDVDQVNSTTYVEHPRLKNPTQSQFSCQGNSAAVSKNQPVNLGGQLVSQ